MRQAEESGTATKPGLSQVHRRRALGTVVGTSEQPPAAIRHFRLPEQFLSNSFADSRVLALWGTRTG